MKPLTIDTRHYQISIGSLEGMLSPLLGERSNSGFFVIIDENVYRLWPQLNWLALRFGAQMLILPSGESHKNLSTCERIWSQLLDFGADRDALVLNIGGGVTGDLGGFCAATYKRGVLFVQIPTTLLAQVDASVGGKLGIDFRHVKNAVGVFREPLAVFIDPAFLSTLPEPELRSGYAEVVKHALVADQSQWEKLVRHTSLQGIDWPGVIEHSVRIKTAIVESDPTERGARKALNFGHTIGHALESWSLDTRQPLRHGEAVAAGMICETFLSEKISGLPANEADSIRRHLGSLFGKISFTPADYPAIFEFLRQDKKNRSGQTRLTLLQAIGSFLIDQPVPDELILESLEIYRKVGWQ